MRRLTAVAVIIAVTLVGCSTPAAAQTALPAPVVTHVDRVCSPVQFPYRVQDVQRFYNCTRDGNIDRPTAGRLTWYLNAVVLNRIAAYLAAVDAARVAQQHQDLVWRWSGVANCESGGNWYINTGNGYYGGVQFLLSTWRSVGGQGYPHQNSPGEQAYRAEILKNRSGLGQWPVCGRYYRG